MRKVVWEGRRTADPSAPLGMTDRSVCTASEGVWKQVLRRETAGPSTPLPWIRCHAALTHGSVCGYVSLWKGHPPSR